MRPFQVEMEEWPGMPLGSLMLMSVLERSFNEGGEYRQAQQNGQRRPHCTFAYSTNRASESEGLMGQPDIAEV